MQKKQLILIVVFIVISVGIFIRPNFPPFTTLSSVIQNIFSSPKALLSQAKSSAIKQDGAVSVDELTKQNEILTEKLIEYEKVKRDNEALRSQFESVEAPDYMLQPASVIGFLGKFSFPSSLIIDKGNLDGIKEGMAVILDNKLIGKIVKVSGQYSEAVLVTSNEFSGLARSSEGNAPGIITGATDFVVFDRVDVNETLTAGEILLTKGEINDTGIGVPPDLIIGKIVSINKNESLPFQTAKVESPIQFSKLDTVFVVLGL